MRGGRRARRPRGTGWPWPDDSRDGRWRPAASARSRQVRAGSRIRGTLAELDRAVAPRAGGRPRQPVRWGAPPPGVGTRRGRRRRATPSPAGTRSSACSIGRHLRGSRSRGPRQRWRRYSGGEAVSMGAIIGRRSMECAPCGRRRRNITTPRQGRAAALRSGHAPADDPSHDPDGRGRRERRAASQGLGRSAGQLRFAAGHPEGHAARRRGGWARSSGTGVATVNGSVGWIGTIWVDPDWRRHGLGMALTPATIERPKTAGCRTLVLVATDAGCRCTSGIGFAVQTDVPDPATRPARRRRGRPRIVPFRPERPAGRRPRWTGRHRRGPDAPAAGVRGRRTRSLRRSGRTAALGGFVIRAPWGGGADDRPRPGRCMTILRAPRRRRARKRVRAGLLAENEAGIAMLSETAGSRPGKSPRLIRGEPLDWHPEAIWGQFNHAVG